MAEQQSKKDLIAERQANLPLPDQPPVASDFNSLDARTVNVGSGGQATGFSAGNDGLREPASGESAFRSGADKTNLLGQGVGREGHDNLGGLPSDALAGNKKDHGVETRNPDYGYPHKNDPTNKQ